MEPKHKLIEQHLQEGNAITGIIAMQGFGVYRLSSVIHRLRKKGMKINTTRYKGYAIYSTK